MVAYTILSKYYSFMFEDYKILSDLASFRTTNKFCSRKLVLKRF